MSFFFFLKFFGRNAIQSAIAHNLGKIGISGWAGLVTDFQAAEKAATLESKPALASALTDILFSIR